MGYYCIQPRHAIYFIYCFIALISFIFPKIVGESIKPHGILFSGGPSITGPVADDLHMEITMLQIYKVALSAGKAHRDHKHHHVHHFDHDGLATTTPPPPPPVVVIIKHF